MRLMHPTPPARDRREAVSSLQGHETVRVRRSHFMARRSPEQTLLSSPRSTNERVHVVGLWSVWFCLPAIEMSEWPIRRSPKDLAKCAAQQRRITAGRHARSNG